MKKRTWIIIGVAVLALCAVGFLVVPGALSNRAAREALANLEMGRVTRTTLSSAVESSGSVVAEDTRGLSFGASGTVAQVTVEPGDRVKQGDVLALLDMADLELQAAQAEQAFLIQQANYSTTVQPDAVAVASAQAAVDSANAAYRAALDKYNLSDDQITVGCANLENAKDALENAQAAYDSVANDWKARNTPLLTARRDQLQAAENNYNVALANCNLTRNGINDSAVRSALAQLEQAKANLANLTSPRAEKIAIAQANVEQARLSWEQARRRLENARIVAPFDGVVTRVNVKEGGPSGTGAAIEIADDSRYHVDVLVDEIEIGNVKEGQPVEVTLDALPNDVLTGRVARVDPAGTISQGVVNYLVRMDLDPTDAPLRLDMTASVRILGETRAGVLAVPTSAIRADADGEYVMVAEPGAGQPGAAAAPQRVAVIVGLGDGELTEVSGDLQEDQIVFISEPPRLQFGFGPFGGGQP